MIDNKIIKNEVEIEAQTNDEGEKNSDHWISVLKRAYDEYIGKNKKRSKKIRKKQNEQIENK